MATSTKRLLLIALGLLGVQWFLLPVISWQNARTSNIGDDLSVVAARSGAIESLPVLQQQMRERSIKLDALSKSAFKPGPTATLEIQRFVTSSLAENRLKVMSFEWAPKVGDSISVARAKVRVMGQSSNVFEWIAKQQSETLWSSVLTLKMRHADPRNLDADVFTSDLTLEFVMGEDDRD